MPRYRGMTTNERLFAANLLEEWDVAARNRDRAKMRELLSRVDLASQAEWIADTVLADPSNTASSLRACVE
jgi:hypothetical protein